MSNIADSDSLILEDPGGETPRVLISRRLCVDHGLIAREAIAHVRRLMEFLAEEVAYIPGIAQTQG